MTCDIEEMCSKDMDETTSEASWTTVTNGEEKEVWSLESEGEAERPEVIGLMSETKDISMNPEDASRHRHAQAKMTRKERDKQTRMEKEINWKTSWDEDAEVQSPKRKVIRIQ